LTKANNTEVFKLNCARVPAANLVVGYSAVAGSFVDAINFIVGPPPVTTNATNAAAPPPSGLNSGAIAGVVIAGCAFVSCVGGIGFQVWKCVKARKDDDKDDENDPNTYNSGGGLFRLYRSESMTANKDAAGKSVV
jgi:hypothetical protein